MLGAGSPYAGRSWDKHVRGGPEGASFSYKQLMAAEMLFSQDGYLLGYFWCEDGGWGLRNGGDGRGECVEFLSETLDLAEQPAECLCECQWFALGRSKYK